MLSIISLCRRGFEKEAAAELLEAATQPAIAQFVRTKEGAGFAELILSPIDNFADQLRANFFVRSTCFSRYSFVAIATIENLPDVDRITPILTALSQLSQKSFSAVRVECPEVDSPPGLLAFTRSFSKRLSQVLKQSGTIVYTADAPILHLFFADYQRCVVGVSLVDSNSLWPGGIPRLRFPPNAPSRSTLKLDEAFQTFLTEEERASHLHAGSTACDLGACPGGWTWQLVSRGIHVTAVDNGSIAPQVMNTGLVEHLPADGFTFSPKTPVDWMVCDIVEQPMRIADLAARWFQNGWCRMAIFNLKLPMKKRYDEFKRCRNHFLSATEGQVERFAARQLYHDREEVTCFATAASTIRRPSRSAQGRNVR